MTTCRSCGAEILWVSTSSRARMPLDAEPCPEGNVVLSTVRERGMRCAHVLSSGEIVEGPRYRPHWATCPQADRWRKP